MLNLITFLKWFLLVKREVGHLQLAMSIVSRFVGERGRLSK